MVTKIPRYKKIWFIPNVVEVDSVSRQLLTSRIQKDLHECQVFSHKCVEDRPYI